MFLALLFAVNQSACGVLCGAEAFASYSHLLERTRFGHIRNEEAAFLVLDDAGHVRSIDWKSGKPDRVSYVGPRFEACIAVIHTHPFGIEPSLGDRQEAQRTQLPIVVVSRTAITVAWPDGTVSRLVDGANWYAMQSPAQR